MKTDPEVAKGHPLITVKALGQEGDEKDVVVNPNEPVSHLLKEALQALYGNPAPSSDTYDVVVGGKWVEPLTKKVHEAGISDGTLVSILPKDISRGTTR